MTEVIVNGRVEKRDLRKMWYAMFRLFAQSEARAECQEHKVSFTQRKNYCLHKFNLR